MAGGGGVFSTSCASVVLTVGYLSMATLNLYRLMNPLYGVDLDAYSAEQMVRPLWDDRTDRHQIMVFLSTRSRFGLDFLTSTGKADDEETPSDVTLLWDEATKDDSSDPLTRTFVLTTKNGEKQNNDDNNDVTLDVDTATAWFEPDTTSSSIGSSSFLLAAYEKLSSLLGSSSSDDDDSAKKEPIHRVVLDDSSPVWTALSSNRTVHAHVVLLQRDSAAKAHPLPPSSLPPDHPNASKERRMRFSDLARNNQVLLGQVSLVKHDDPVPVKPRRVLYHDLAHLFRAHVKGDVDAVAPWRFEVTQPKAFAEYNAARDDKQRGVGRPYFKPEVAVRLVAENAPYPLDHVGRSGMDVVRLDSKEHPSGYAYLPPLHVDEMGLTSEKYVPLNATVAAVPLRVKLDTTSRSDTSLSPRRYRLLRHFGESLRAQKDSGLFEDDDVDDVKRLIADTNVALLAVTMLASVLHLLFEFLTLKSDVDFWKGNTDLTGLSVRALFVDVIFQIVILLYLIETDASILMTLPSAVGILIAMWKCRRSTGLTFVKKKMARYNAKNEENTTAWYNKFFSLFGYELKATRMVGNRSSDNDEDKENEKKLSPAELRRIELARLTDESDRLATRTLGAVLGPIVVAYALRTLVNDEYSGWYSWLVTTASGAVYALGFVLMTPQLFLNHRLRSVAHLPWRVLGYRFVNTFIDDLFAFIIRMPTMARISCFRDDVVFFAYLAQRYAYPVDASRPAEGVGAASEGGVVVATAVEQEEDKKTK